MKACLDFLWVYIYKHLLRRVKIFTQYHGHIYNSFLFFNKFFRIIVLKLPFADSKIWVSFGNIFALFYTNQCYKLASPFLLNQKPIYCTYCETYASGIAIVYIAGRQVFFSDGPIFPVFFRLKMGKLRGTVAEQGAIFHLKICYSWLYRI